jgi:hypothetical protein
MENQTPRKLGEYLLGDYDPIIGKKFQLGGCVYEVTNIYSDIKTRDIAAHMWVCDEDGFSDTDTYNLNIYEGLRENAIELIKGVNAVRVINPIAASIMERYLIK